MSNDYFTDSGVPGTGAGVTSATLRSEFQAIENAFDKMSPLTGNNSKIIRVKSDASGQEAKTAEELGLATSVQLQNNTYTWCSLAGGTANAITLTPTTAITAYTAGQSFVFKAASTNTGSTTAQISGIASPPTLKRNGSNLLGGEIVANKWYRITLVTAGEAQLEWIDVSLSGELKLYDSGALTNQGSFPVTSVITSEFANYRIEADLLSVAGAADLWFRISTDNGSSYLSGAAVYAYARWANGSDGSSGTAGSSGDSKMVMFGSATAVYPLRLQVWLRAQQSASGSLVNVQYRVTGTIAGVLYNISGSGYHVSVTDCNAFTLLYSTGNISGRVRVYGSN
jgi:hypothetical protein